jgi:hypothetical protein
MRAVTERQAVVEYARVHRIVSQDELMPADLDFSNNVVDRLRQAEGRPIEWFSRTWRLGNVEVVSTEQYADATRLAEGRAVTGRHGWAAEVDSGELAPRYDEQRHSWLVEPSVRVEGAVGLFVLEFESQIMAVVNYSGRDLSMAGFCNTMTELLNAAERERRSAVHASVQWLVEPLHEPGSFAQWLGTIAEVTHITANFHLPNPTPRPILEPAFELLDGLNSTNATLGAESTKPGGLDPNGHPLMQAAVAMQEADYGHVRAKGVQPSGDPSKYNSRDYQARDTLEQDEVPELSVSGLVAMLIRVLASRIERRARERGDR